MLWGGIAVARAAARGALWRWGLGVWLTPLFPTVPLGTLAANLIGGFIMGLCMEYFSRNAAVPPEVRLALTTGFLGGLTTFSTFSAETSTLLLERDMLWTVVIIGGHLLRSLLPTLLGTCCMRAVFVLARP